MPRPATFMAQAYNRSEAANVMEKIDAYLPHPRIKLYPTFEFTLSTARRKALSWFEQTPFPLLSENDLIGLFQNDDRVLHRVGLYILEHQAAAAMPALRDMLAAQLHTLDPGTRADTLEALYAIDPARIWPHVRELTQNGVIDSELRTALSHILPKVGNEEALTLARYMAYSRHSDDTSLAHAAVQEAMIQLVQTIARNQHQSPTEALWGLVEDDWNPGIQMGAIRILGEEGGLEIIPRLEKIIPVDEEVESSPVGKAAASAIIQIMVRHKQWDSLERIARHRELSMREALIDQLSTADLAPNLRMALLQILLHDPDPQIVNCADRLRIAMATPEFSATPRTGVRAALEHLAEEERRLAEKYTDAFGGFVIRGSVAKGYGVESHSDVDLALVTTQPDVVRDIEHSLKRTSLPIHLLQERADGMLDSESLNRQLPSYVFAGRVFRFTKHLEHFQAKILAETSLWEWAVYSAYSYSQMTNLRKLFDRFEVQDPVVRDQLQFMTALKQVAPPLEESRAALARRAA